MQQRDALDAWSMFIFQLPAISGVRSKLPLVEVVIVISILA
ncbi:hypothetical protein [Arthrobacter psychrolactophilus]